MKTRHQVARTVDRGFVLVGVVMFVLALTILGLSLFSLSSYEGQFVERSLKESEALYAVQSGLERAKFVLAKRRELRAVHDDILDSPATYYACAWQSGETTGVLQLNVDVRIRVAANVGGERRMVEAQYTPQETDSYYKRLMTASDDVEILNDPNHCDETSLNGVIWLGDKSVPGWNACAPFDAHYERDVEPKKVIPAPDVTSFFDQYWDSAVPMSHDLTTTNVLFPIDPRNPCFFRTVGDDSVHTGFSFCFGLDDTATTIDVTNRGTVIWLLDHGFLAERLLRVIGTANDCLVIVSHKNQFTNGNPGEDRIGVWFRGGLQSDVVPVILVCDEEVRIRHANDADRSSRVNYLSVFSKDVTVAGPDPPEMMRLYHDPESPYDQRDGLIDQLCDIGALPNSSSQGLTFLRVPGTWMVFRDPDNPPPVTN